MSSAERLIEAFDRQIGWCAPMGSRFIVEILTALRDDLKAGGPTADRIAERNPDVLPEALPMCFAGALHAAVLTNRDAKLASLYPRDGRDWNFAEIWPVARDFLAREPAWVASFLQGPPQTNETRRSIGLLPAFLACAQHGPLHLLEVGASAGLNLMWDRFRYETSTLSWGERGGPLIDTDWSAPAPEHLDTRVVVASRAACDRNPLDVNNPEHALRLRAFIWPDQPDRLARIDAAIALARASGVKVERADVADWLAARLAGPLPEGVTVIYHSVFWHYLPGETMAAATRVIENAGAHADDAHRVAWVRYEVNPVIGLGGPFDEMAVDVRIWPGEERRVLLRVDGHARKVWPV